MTVSTQHRVMCMLLFYITLLSSIFGTNIIKYWLLKGWINLKSLKTQHWNIFRGLDLIPNHDKVLIFKKPKEQRLWKYQNIFSQRQKYSFWVNELWTYSNRNVSQDTTLIPQLRLKFRLKQKSDLLQTIWVYLHLIDNACEWLCVFFRWSYGILLWELSTMGENNLSDHWNVRNATFSFKWLKSLSLYDWNVSLGEFLVCSCEFTLVLRFKIWKNEQKESRK